LISGFYIQNHECKDILSPRELWSVQNQHITAAAKEI
jgi:hypothetical protein